MRLYRMELYKIYHNKALVKACIVAVVIWMLFFWFVEVREEIATVKEEYYQGYEAVQKNREITEEFKGILTDEKLEKIVEKYGFPKIVVKDYGRFCDENYLTAFVTDYFTDGYMRGWNEGEYKISTKLYPIAKTEIGSWEKEIPLYYTKGWSVLLEMFQLGMVLGSITIIIGVSGAFSEESQINMLPLLFTTERGKKEDIIAKILAVFTLVISVYAIMTALSVMLSYLVFGLDGAESPYWLITGRYGRMNITIGKLTIAVLEMGLIALVNLCTIVLCVSSHFRNTFQSVVVSSVCWGAPVLIRMLLGGFGHLLVCSTPVFMIMYRSVMETMSVLSVLIVIAVAESVVCVMNGYFSYKKM